MPTYRDVMNAQKQRLLEQAEQIERDQRDLERLLTKYDLCVIVSPPEPTPPERFTRTQFHSGSAGSRVDYQGGGASAANS